jgi:hypothetical protein
MRKWFSIAAIPPLLAAGFFIRKERKLRKKENRCVGAGFKPARFVFNFSNSKLT